VGESLINLAFAGVFSIVSLGLGLRHARKFGLLSAWPYFTLFGVCAGIALQNEAWFLWAFGAGAVALTLHILNDAEK
jgi:hypothetical protein